MQKFELNEDNFVLYLMKHYDNPGCMGIQEFYDDTKRFSYLRRLFKKYDSLDELRERLIINHLVVLNNLFGVEATTKALLYKVEPEFYSSLKTFMLYLNMNVDELDDVALDDNIIEVLRKL